MSLGCTKSFKTFWFSYRIYENIFNFIPESAVELFRYNHHYQEIHCFPYLLKTDKFLFPLIHRHKFSFVPLSVIELEYLFKIARAFCCHFVVFLQKVSRRTKKHCYLFFDGQLFPEHLNHFSYGILACSIFFYIQKEFIRFFTKFIPVASTSDFNSICYFIRNNIKIFLANSALIFSLFTVPSDSFSFSSKFNFFSRIDLVLFFEKLIVNLKISYLKNSHFIWWLKSQ